PGARAHDVLRLRVLSLERAGAVSAAAKGGADQSAGLCQRRSAGRVGAAGSTHITRDRDGSAGAGGCLAARGWLEAVPQEGDHLSARYASTGCRVVTTPSVLMRISMSRCSRASLCEGSRPRFTIASISLKRASNLACSCGI